VGLSGRTDVGWQRLALAAAFGGRARLAAAALLLLAQLAPALLIGFGLAGGRRVYARRDHLHWKGDYVHGCAGDRANDAARKGGKEKNRQ
jgi:hypothetical protein